MYGKDSLKGTQPLAGFQCGDSQGKRNLKGTQPLAELQRGDGQGKREPERYTAVSWINFNMEMVRKKRT